VIDPLRPDAFAQEALFVHEIRAAQRAAASPDASVWMGASAGSGKTTVLTDRVTRLLLDGVRPEKILCLTFTRAAASEMALRLTRRLARWAVCGDRELDDSLAELFSSACAPAQRERARHLFAGVLSCPGGMRFMTIHAFAQEILRRFPLEAGVSPTFMVMEDGDARALWQRSYRATLRALADEPEGAASFSLRLLTRTMAEKTVGEIVKNLSQQAGRLRRAISAAGGEKGWETALFSALALEKEASAETIVKAAAREGAFDRFALKKAADILSDQGTPSFGKSAHAIRTWLAGDEESRARTLDAYAGAFLTKGKAIKSKLANKKIVEQAPDVESALRTEALRLRSVAERLESLAIARETSAAVRFALTVADGYEDEKRRRNALDFADMIEKAKLLLSNAEATAWVLYKLDGGVDHLLLDEAQDTNPDQWAIVQALVEEFFAGEGARVGSRRTVFVVGDEKQSIYSFQGADVAVFARMSARIEALAKGARMPFRRVPLDISFRSAPAVLRAVDAVFAAPSMWRGVSSSAPFHKAFRADGRGRVEVWPLVRAGERAQGRGPKSWALPLSYESWRPPSALLADDIARRIKSWVASGHAVFDRTIGAERPMTYGDVMILVQQRGAFAPRMIAALKKEGIAVAGSDRMRLVQQLAVMDLVALLRFFLLPQDDLTLATVLLSPLLGLDDDALMGLALGREERSLWQRMGETAAAEPAGRIARARAYLEALMNKADILSPLALLSTLLADPCPADEGSGRRAMLRRLGRQAEDPIDELLNAAESFSARVAPSLQAFLRWLEESDPEIKREMEIAGGSVRVITVHGSKGLEAPVVILPDAMRPVTRKTLLPLLWDETCGLPFLLRRDPINGVLRALRDKAHEEEREEHRRLLYVAMTRAADRLYVGGFAQDRGTEEDDEPPPSGSWYDAIVAALAPCHQKDVEADRASPSETVVLADYAPVSGPEGERKAPSDAAPRAAPPPWAFTPPSRDPVAPRLLIPSRGEEEGEAAAARLSAPPDERFARGRIMHLLLQKLAALPVEARENAARRFLGHPRHALSVAQQQAMAGDVLSLLREPRLSPLFGPNSRSEVPVMGLSGSRLVCGQVDRLALVEGEVWIVDYKTNKRTPKDQRAIPETYRAQMEAYRSVLRAVYPDRAVRCFLLWTQDLRMMEVA